ncbi:enoyl- delta isomerase mitochondrial-like protein [Lasius niger]|uniref:Enoyl-delta isomerase mitochondrial-like protein n=1 Tax=Lasius niger TaxID=67767 RepID=A0A0J7L8T8_LASNI|nr:enoyl- delta isomerase mitochondrial-like protein [Lasius niger]
MYKELTILLNESAKDNKVLIFALTANGDFFSSGNDLGASMATEMTPTTIENANSTVKDFIDAIIMYPKLLIAVVNGPAIGIASTILGIFDIVYASDKAGDMLYLGYKMNAQEAKKYGLVSKVYNHDSLEEVWDYLNNVSKLSSESILATKRLMSKWDREILLKVNAEEMKELKKRLESPDLIERFLNFLSRKNKL